MGTDIHHATAETWGPIAPAEDRVRRLVATLVQRDVRQTDCVDTYELFHSRSTGGSWYVECDYRRSALRFGFKPTSYSGFLGF